MEKHTPEEIDAMMSPFKVQTNRNFPHPEWYYQEWYYKDELKTEEEIADIANKLYRDFCISLVGNGPLTPKEVEHGLELEKRWQYEQGINELT